MVGADMELLTKIKVENFKSLKNFEMTFNQFNVLIGPNGAGKTNVLELIEFVNLCISAEKTPAYPFGNWGGYKNIVWAGNEHEPISLQISYTIDDHSVIYDATITGSNNGRLELLEEKLQIENYLEMNLDTDKVYYNVDSAFAKQVDSEEMQPRLNRPYALVDFNKDFVLPRIDTGTSILKANKLDEKISPKRRISMLHTAMVVDDEVRVYRLPSPIIQKNTRPSSLYKSATDYLVTGKNIILLRQLNYSKLRLSTPLNYSTELDKDGDGLINLLFRWFNKNQRLPEIITLALEALFPNWQISFKVTHDSNIILEINDGAMRLAPTSIPDGFYKLLTILAAIELKPKILLIDEIDTSLHARIIEYIIGLLKNIDTTVIITTHSPTVVDFVNAEDLILLERTGHKSTCRRIKDPDKLRKELTAKGITVSESWLYGEL